MSFEDKVASSFKRAKSDIVRLQEEVLGIAESQRDLMLILDELRSSHIRLSEMVGKSSGKKVKVVRGSTQRKAQSYLASSTGKTFHVKECPFAQNIKSGNRKVFSTKLKAVNAGFKPCKCTR